MTVQRGKSLPYPSDPVRAARSAGLRYVRVDSPGISRVRCGKGFRYLDPNGQPVRDAATLSRIRALAIPPAWTHVWVCPLAEGHIQAIGQDARGRRQYRYHADWRAVRDEAKFDRLIAFGQSLPQLRARVAADLALAGLPRPRVLATVVCLLEQSLIRIGNEEYARTNGSFGLTTLRNHHVQVNGGTVRFAFRGKSGIRHRIDVNDRRLAQVVRRCQELPGQDLFQYVDEQGTARTVGSADVNDYLREATGAEFTAKDFRTWGATVLAAEALAACQPGDTLVKTIERVARRLGNTCSVCRKCYIHPAIVDAYLEGSLQEALARQRSEAAELQPIEAAVLGFLRARNGSSKPRTK